MYSVPPEGKCCHSTPAVTPSARYYSLFDIFWADEHVAADHEVFGRFRNGRHVVCFSSNLAPPRWVVAFHKRFGVLSGFVLLHGSEPPIWWLTLQKATKRHIDKRCRRPALAATNLWLMSHVELGNRAIC